MTIRRHLPTAAIRRLSDGGTTILGELVSPAFSLVGAADAVAAAEAVDAPIASTHSF